MTKNTANRIPDIESCKENVVVNKPKGFEEYLSRHKECFFDSCCGEPVSWGFELIRRIDNDERFHELGKFGVLECNHGYPSKWYLITKSLTRNDAIKKYGEVTSEEFGPRGGFKSVTFGKTRFFSRSLQ